MSADLPRFRPLAPRRLRRRLVLTMGLGYGLYLGTVALSSAAALPPAALIAGALLGLGLMFAGGIRLMKPSRLGLPEGRVHELDERQAQRLAQMHILAYRLLGALFMLAALYFTLAFRNGQLPIPRSDFAWTSVYLGAILLIPVLPTAILAWTEPDLED
ncbi:hypothetical protein SAMN04488058_1367 [Deinococcus reticulitermitis]|uniref:Uncharacterized protein n=1 Tax=Deinococcus reticulitermitis TaxID=856736 RepID=A0A1H7CPS1_9DEIO|nr:hypothetical protein [Deinococcus reticulitermitis]SEJ91753.1 hypothetical protein SAMN04488058_1367 [Deinococcus reticulitermitis]